MRRAKNKSSFTGGIYYQYSIPWDKWMGRLYDIGYRYRYMGSKFK